MNFPIVGDRTLLRPFAIDDADEMLGVYGSADVMRYVGNGQPVTTLTDVRAMLATYIAHQQQHGYAFWAVVNRQPGALMGDAGLEVQLNGEVELGYTLAPAYWGKGYATEVAQLCVTAAFRDLNIPTLTALADAGNDASARVLTKAGFVEGEQRQAYGRAHRTFVLHNPTIASNGTDT